MKKVYPGDVVTMQVHVKYADFNSDEVNIMPLVSYLGSAFAMTPGIDGSILPSFDFMEGALYSGMLANSTTGEAPRAFLNYILLDNNLQVQMKEDGITSRVGILQVSEAAKIPEDGSGGNHELLELEVTIQKEGYIYTYVSNDDQQDMDVYFDDFKITHNLNDIVAGGDYYPFGLAMSGRQITRDDYRFGYQGQFSEFDEETGWNAFELRMYDPVVGRWMAVDPARQFYSPYVGMGNSPVIGVDPTGGECPTCPQDAKYDQYRNNDALFAYNPAVGVYSDYNISVTGSQTWGDQLWNALWRLDQRIQNAPGFTMMNSPGTGGTPLVDGRSGSAEFIMMDPTSGLVVFKTPKGMIKLDTRKNFSKSDIKKLQDLLSDGKFLAEFSSQGADDVVKIMKSALRSNNNYHSGLKPQWIKGPGGVAQRSDSVPKNFPDTLSIERIEKIPGWKGVRNWYENSPKNR